MSGSRWLGPARLTDAQLAKVAVAFEAAARKHPERPNRPYGGRR